MKVLVLIFVMLLFPKSILAADICFSGVEDLKGRSVPASYEEWYDQTYRMYQAADGLRCETLQAYKELTDGVIETIEVVETVMKNNRKFAKFKVIVSTVKTGVRVVKVYLSDLPCSDETKKEIEQKITYDICTSDEVLGSNMTCRNVNSSDDILPFDWKITPKNMCMPGNSYEI